MRVLPPPLPATRNTRSRPRVARLWAIAFLLTAFCAHAETARTIQHRFNSARADKQVEEILYLASGVELANAGYSSTKSDGAPFILTTTYEIKDAMADIHMVLQKVANPPQELAAADFRAALDLSIDEEVAGAVRRLIAQLAQAIPEPAEGKPEIADLFSSPLITERDTLRTPKTFRIESVAECGGTVYFGVFSEYAAYGANAAFQAGALFIKRDWSLSLGPRVTVTGTFTNSGVSGGNLYISTAGGNIQFGLGSSQRLRLAGCVSGGAAVMSLSENGALLSKTVPYADAGVQAGFPLGKDFFLGGDVRFQAVFDPEILIMGISASAALCKEF